MISPCLISPAGSDFLTAQMITSPTCATLRLNLPLLLLPRSTLMHIACLAPVLSAMSTYVCCWIMTTQTQSEITISFLLRRFAGHHFLGRYLHRPFGGA